MWFSKFSSPRYKNKGDGYLLIAWRFFSIHDIMACVQCKMNTIMGYRRYEPNFKGINMPIPCYNMQHRRFHLFETYQTHLTSFDWHYPLVQKCLSIYNLLSFISIPCIMYSNRKYATTEKREFTSFDFLSSQDPCICFDTINNYPCELLNILGL